MLCGQTRARVFNGAAAVRSSSHFFRKAERWCATRNDDYSFVSAHGRPEACPIVLRKSLSVVCLSKRTGPEPESPDPVFPKRPLSPTKCLPTSVRRRSALRPRRRAPPAARSRRGRTTARRLRRGWRSMSSHCPTGCRSRRSPTTPSIRPRCCKSPGWSRLRASSCP